MATRKPSIYTTRLVSSSRGGVWMADDHLLVANSALSMFESYRRFYFTDIQAIVMQPSARSLAWRWVMVLVSIPIILAGAGMLYMQSAQVYLLVLGLSAMALALLWIFLAFFLTRHKSCRCELRTFTQTFDLSSVIRDERQFRRLLEAIEPKVRDCQGTPTQEDLAARAESWNQDAQDAAKVHRERQRVSQQRAQEREAAQKSSPKSPPLLKRILPVWHWIGVGGVALLILINIVGLSTLESPAVTILLALLEMCTAGVMVGAVVHQLGSNMPRSLQAFPWLTLGVQLIACCASVVLFFVGLSMAQQGNHDTTLVLVKRLLEMLALVGIGLAGATGLVRYASSPVDAPAEPGPGAPEAAPVTPAVMPESLPPPVAADDVAHDPSPLQEAPPPGEPDIDPDQSRD